jgi:tetratricopeptide (TPR) repeat protein
MRYHLAALGALMIVGTGLKAQTAARDIAAGDSAHTALNAALALRHYEAAISLDSLNAEALWKASRDVVDLGEAAGFAGNDQTRDSLYRVGEQYATRAVQANPKSSMAHFAMARALGRAALAVGSRERIKYAKRVREQGLKAIELDSLNDGAWHVMGEWNAEIMRLNGFVRFLARNLLGGQVMGQASWDNAQHDLMRAVALRPDRIVHHLDLGQVYADVGKKDLAREQFNQVLSLPAVEYNDVNYQHQAQQALDRLK